MRLTYARYADTRVPCGPPVPRVEVPDVSDVSERLSGDTRDRPMATHREDVSLAGMPSAGTGRLSRRASLNALAAGLDFAARIVVELLLTPLLVARLGASLYGVWRVLWQWTGYVWATSGRSSQALQSA